MVNVATQAMCEHICDTCPIRPVHWFIEPNFSGDKKATYLGLQAGRGRKVTASVEIPDKYIKRYLHTDTKTLLKYCRTANLGAMLSGQFGVQAHYANALAAFYIATGQDAACVSESAIGFTRVEPCEGVFLPLSRCPIFLLVQSAAARAYRHNRQGFQLQGLKAQVKRQIIRF